MIADAIAVVFIFGGAVFSLIAAVGIVRMPDLFTRMQAAAKTGTLGVGCTIIGVAIHFGDLGIAIRAAMIVLFLFMTAPIAAHMIARAGYLAGTQLWEGTVTDELEGQYDQRTHRLRHGVRRAAAPRDRDDPA